MLEGVKVIEYATYIAAPGAGGMLCEWGADVIKVEPLGGDPIRLFFGSLGADNLDGNPVFELDNRGKKGIAVDTGSPEGADVVRKLAETADIFLTNVRYASLKRSGLDYDTLCARNPGLVYANVSGYGLEGDEAWRPGFDIAAFWSRSGVGHSFTPKGAEPATLRSAFGDHVTSLATASAILAALYERTQTGKGRFVETSLLRTGMYALGSDMSIQLKFGRLASTKSRHDSANPMGNFFKCSDGKWICLVPRQGNADWASYVKVLDRPDLMDDERFTTSKARRANGRDLVDLIDAEFAKHPFEVWAKRLDEADLAWAPFQSPAEAAQDPQAEAAGAFVDVKRHDGTGTFRSPATPARFHNYQQGALDPAPTIGQHTDEVLESYGFDLDKLRAAGVIK